MKDSELQQKLVTWQLPPVSEKAQSKAAWHALMAFRQRSDQAPSSVPHPARSVFSWKILTTAFCAAGLLLGLVFFTWSENSTKAPATISLLNEFEDFFQGRVTAVVQHRGEIDLQLNEVASPRPSDQQVAVRLVWQNETFFILTYSGNSVCLQSDDGSICFTPLINGSGDVILLGENGLLDHQRGIRAEARTLHET